jgi:replication-associated recombination protein RarA
MYATVFIIRRCGKTTLARILSGFTDAIFKEVSATISTVNEVCAIFEEARAQLQSTGRCVG